MSAFNLILLVTASTLSLYQLPGSERLQVAPSHLIVITSNRIPGVKVIKEQRGFYESSMQSF
jgi:hypothetical protein